jgi:O-antigen ligase
MSSANPLSGKPATARQRLFFVLPRYPSTYLLAAYLFFLFAAATQPLSFLRNGRWVALAAMLLYWLLSGRPIRNSGRRTGRSLNAVAVAYLLACCASAVVGICPYMSACKLLSFSALLMACMILARERARPEEAREWVRITLVILLIAGPAVAIAPSKAKPTDQAILFRGAAGDANTMGHVTSLALLALILIRERLGPDHPLRAVSLIALIVLGGLLLATKARSSAFSVAVGLYFALAYLPRLRHTLVGVVVLGTIALVAVGSLEDTVKGFVFKARVSSLSVDADRSGLENAWAKIFATRIPQWERAWQAFWKRPALGWGFGASETTPPEWEFSFQAIGRLEEVNNDFLQVAEGVGFIGLVFHVALILIVLIEGRPPPGSKNFEWIAVYCLSWALWANFMLDGASQAIGFLTAGLFWILLSLTACPALQESHPVRPLGVRIPPGAPGPGRPKGPLPGQLRPG